MAESREVEGEGRLNSGGLSEFREEAEDGFGRLEEMDGGAVSNSGALLPSDRHRTPDHLAVEPDRLAGSAQFHLAG